MPTQTYNRIWCKSCNDFTLHSRSYKKKTFLDDVDLAAENSNSELIDLTCKECKTPYTSILLSEIPNDKLVEQRKRYKESKEKEFSKLFGGMLGGYDGGMSSLFSEKWPEPEIFESDAGQKKIDKKQHEINEEGRRKAQEQQAALNEEYKKFSSLGRNDICACGSGLKYKKCCLSKFS